MGVPTSSWPDEAPIEVILDGPLDGRDPGRSVEATPPRRRLGLLVGAAGAVLAFVVIAQLAVPRDEPEDRPATSEPAEVARAITMPTTLPPPASESAGGSLGAGLASAVSIVPPLEPATAPPHLMTLPSRTALIGTEPDTIDGVDLTAAIADLSDDRARRATTTVQWGDVPGTLEVAVTRDPASDRDLVEYRTTAGRDVAIIDHRSATVFLGGERVADTGSEWVVLTAEQALAGTGASSLRELADELLLGPLRAPALTMAMVEPAPWPELVADETTLAFEISLPADQLSAWLAYPLRPEIVDGDDVARAEPPSTTRLTAFVGVDGTLRQLTHRVRIGGVPQVFIHRLDDLAEPVAIELPQFDVGPPATTALPAIVHGPALLG